MTKPDRSFAWATEMDISIILIFAFAGQMNHTQDNLSVDDCVEGRIGCCSVHGVYIKGQKHDIIINIRL